LNERRAQPGLTTTTTKHPRANGSIAGKKPAMSDIAIITDSTCGLPKELIERYKLIVAPCQVRIGEQVYREGVDLTAEELFHRMFTSQATPATSLPAGEDYAAAFEEVLRRGATKVLGLFVGSQLSGTFSGARLAAQE